jgi:hypothetical protein
METVRACAKGRSSIKVIVIELDSIDVEILGSWADDSVRTCPVKAAFSVGSLSDNQGILDSSSAFTYLIGQRELDTCQEVISNLEVFEDYPADSLSNRTISIIFPTCQIVESGLEQGILPKWIGRI